MMNIHWSWPVLEHNDDRNHKAIQGHMTGTRIESIHRTYNVPVQRPALQYFVTELCTCVHITVAEWCIMGRLFDALWNLSDGFINNIFQGNRFMYVVLVFLWCVTSDLLHNLYNNMSKT